MAFVLGMIKHKFFPIFTNFLSQANKHDCVADLYKTKPLGCIASIKGWVRELRKSKNYIFINVNDGSCSDSIQIVLSRIIFSKELNNGSSVSVTGKLSSDHRGNIEIYADNIVVLGQCDVTDGYPFTKGQKHSLDYCRQYLHHRPKLPFFSSLLRTRHSAALAVHKYFNDNKFLGIHTPVLTSNDCEGAGETFSVNPSSEILLKELETNGKHKEEIFFNNRAYLTVSGQFHLEAIARSIPKVYTFNPTFRAENSKSRVHLAEFYMVEAEEAFIDSLTHVLSTIEALVKSLISNLVAICERDINFILENNETNSKEHLKTLERILEKPFAVMTYTEAKDIIDQHKSSIKYEKPRSSGFTKEEELFLVKHNDNVPVFIINWPKHLKSFYAKTSYENNDEVQAVDLLVPVVGELCGGSMREDDFDLLRAKLQESKLMQNLDWYLELRRFGNVPTGGFGMGFERFLQFALNISNIKDTIPFPRWPHNLQL